MGFSDLGRSILRNNDRLRSNIKVKYFRYSKEGRQRREGKDKKYLPKLELKNRDKEYRHLNGANIVMLILVIVFTFLAYLTFDRYFGEAHADYLANLESMSEQAVEHEHNEAYNQLINNGYKYLTTGQYDKAQWAFTKALKVYPSGKKANYGMTMTLINQCVLNSQYCELSQSYLEQLKKSEKFSSEELDNLEQIKDR